MNRHGLPVPIAALLAVVLATVVPAPAVLAQSAPASPPPAGDGNGSPLTLAEALRLAAERHPLLLDAAGRRQVRTGDASRLAAFANPHLEWRREGMGATAPVDEFVTVALPLDVT